MPSLWIARLRVHPDINRSAAGIALLLASSCSLTAPSDGDLMDRPARVDSGLAGSGGDALRDAGDDVTAVDAGGAGGRDGAAGDAAPPPRCEPACAAKEVCLVQGDSARCIAPAAALDGQRWELPCGEIYGTKQWNCRSWPAGSTTCPPQGHTPVDRRVTFGGQANVTYDVTFRFRGIVEPKLYAGGVADGSFYVGGGPAANSENYNSYGFTVSSDPPKNYYLNYSENKADYVFAFAYDRTLPIKGQTEVRLFATAPTCGLLRNCQDLNAVPNCTPYAVPGGPAAYNGHFIEMEVLSVKQR